MGEYVKLHGQDVKLGTCESLYCTTLEQLKKELPNMNQESGNLPPSAYLDPANRFRYRFPFPDEAGTEIGSYENYDRGFLLKVPKSLGIEIGHGTIFYRTDSQKRDPRTGDTPPAIGIKLPCPHSEQPGYEFYDWSDSRESTVFEIVRQGIITDPEQTDGTPEVQAVVRCPYCGDMCRLNKTEAKAVNDWIQENGTEKEKEITRIMFEGYDNPPQWIKELALIEA